MKTITQKAWIYISFSKRIMAVTTFVVFRVETPVALNCKSKVGRQRELWKKSVAAQKHWIYILDHPPSFRLTK